MKRKSTKPKRGRPPLPPGERRDAAVKVRLTEQQLVDCTSLATEDGLDVAAWVRMAVAHEIARRREAKSGRGSAS